MSISLGKYKGLSVKKAVGSCYSQMMASRY